jgi:hypothetical protein
MGKACSTNGENGNAYRILLGKPEKKRDHWQEKEVGGWATLKWILEKYDGMVWNGLIRLRIGTSEGLL